MAERSSSCPTIDTSSKDWRRRSSRSATERQSSIRAPTPSSSGTKKIRRAKARRDWKDRRHATKHKRPVPDASSGHPSGLCREVLKRPGQQARRPLHLRRVASTNVRTPRLGASCESNKSGARKSIGWKRGSPRERERRGGGK